VARRERITCVPIIQVKSYTSPTLVLLAFNWEPGGQREDFLGFAIERTPDKPSGTVR